jgi:hypothetical protein
MKQSIFFIACLIALVTCSAPAVQNDKTYNWMLDMFVLSFDTVIIAVLTPIWFLASLIAGCQRCYIDMVD